MTDSRQGLLWARRIPRRSLCTALGCFQLGLSEVFKIDRCKNGESVVDEHVDRPIVDAVLGCVCLIDEMSEYRISIEAMEVGHHRQRRARSDEISIKLLDLGLVF